MGRGWWAWRFATTVTTGTGLLRGTTAVGMGRGLGPAIAQPLRMSGHAEVAAALPERSSEPQTGPQHAQRGRTFIADEVVTVIARIAAEQVPGIHRIGEPSLRNLLAGLGRGTGVAAEVGVQEAAADIDVVVEYGHPIRAVAGAIRTAIIDAVEHMTGCRVVEVNVHVIDVHVPKLEAKPRRELR